jgi:hypothetical protein
MCPVWFWCAIINVVSGSYHSDGSPVSQPVGRQLVAAWLDDKSSQSMRVSAREPSIGTRTEYRHENTA